MIPLAVAPLFIKAKVLAELPPPVIPPVTVNKAVLLFVRVFVVALFAKII